MKHKLIDPASDKTSVPALSRRSVFAGAGALGALGVVAAALARSQPAATLATSATAQPTEDGYRLTEHIRRYYQTARV